MLCDRGAVRRLAVLIALLLLLPLGACGGTSGDAPAKAERVASSTTMSTTMSTTAARVGHVFVINLENKGFTRTWGRASTAPYLARTLRAKGVLLTSYYGTAHNSQGNYVAQVSGQGPTVEMQRDCKVFANLNAVRVAAYDQRVGHGCVFDARTPTLMKQLDAKRLSWRGYMQDIDYSCQHPRIGAADRSLHARVGHQYANRHNPFVYFHSVIDRPSYCRSHVVDHSRLTTDLRSVSTTRTLTYITPDLCSDAHDSPCADGRRGGLPAFDAFLRTWAPRILASPAFRKDGVLVITADESDSASTDARACCGEGATPNVARPGVTGPGGGRIGTLVISRWTRPGSTSTTPYNHYSLLGSIERWFGLPLIGYARLPQQRQFGADVLNH
jgi:hypothetical protein